MIVLELLAEIVVWLLGLVWDFCFWGGSLRSSDYVTGPAIRSRSRRRGLLFGCIICVVLVVLVILVSGLLV